MNRILLYLSGLFAIIFCPVIGAAQTVDPYLESITPTSIVVNWKTSIGVTPIVRYGADANNLTNVITGTTQVLTDVGYNNNYYYHTVKLRGLLPASKYYYRVVSDNDSSNIYSFRTLPVPGTAPNASNHLRFLIMGDDQLSEPRYDSLMMAAKRKLTELYGADFNDSVSFISMAGDQVDAGTLAQYENIHFKKTRYLSQYLPIQTCVGNHETYGTIGLTAYRKHFELDSMNYKGIYSGTEDYYAFQIGNVVMAYLNTEPSATSNTDATQFNWIKKIIDSANADPGVKWVITTTHRPYQAEQYVGDISNWIRNTVVPYAMQSPKYFMHIGAHHHLYARGQMKDAPAYNIISGGTAWNQYWGMSSEQNFDDVQKTIANWAYQLVDVDMVQDKIDIVSYSIGSLYNKRENMVIDSFHRYKNAPAPLQPSVTNAFPDSLQLPYTFTSTGFQSTAGELLNSTEFQVAANKTFSVVEKSSYRHYQDIYGAVPGGTPDTAVDLNQGVDITQYTLPSGAIGNGWHYVRVRHRDRNLSWSAWSATDSFKVYNSTIFNPVIALDSTRFSTGSTIRVTFTNGSADPGAWIGIYKKGQTPGSSTPSQTWRNTNGVSGVVSFTLSQPGQYYAAYFGTSAYTEIATRVPFYHGSIPVLTIPASNYNVGQTVPITFANAPALSKDWIGIYKIGMTPGGPVSVKWAYTTSAPSTTSGTNIAAGTFNATGLPKGYYFASYFLQDAYAEATPRIFFSVGDTITHLTINNTGYNIDLNEYISATWSDGPGNPKDWLGIYNQGADPNSNDPLVSYTYIDGLPNGTKDIPASSMPQNAGNYFVVLFTNDSYNEVSNRVSFQMIGGAPLPTHLLEFTGKAAGDEHLLSWKMGSEEAVSQYILQHSLDGKSFKNIYETKVNASLNGKYEFMNPDIAAGQNYYRLNMRENNGHDNYSGMVKIHQNENGESTVTVYPNPVSSSNRSVVESPYPIDQIDILDTKGQLIYQSKNINNNKFSLLHQDLPPGTYFIKIYSRKLFTAKLVVN